MIPKDATQLQRMHKSDIQSHNIVVLGGVIEKIPAIKAMGWVETSPTVIEDAVVRLNEPVYFHIDGVLQATRETPHGLKLTVAVPEMGVPLFAEFDVYTSVDVYEAHSAVGDAYTDALMSLRQLKVLPETKIAYIKQPQQVQGR